MRTENFSIDHLDNAIDEWLGAHYQYEKFSPEKGHLDEYLLPLVQKIESHHVKKVIVGGTNGKGEVSLHLEEMALQNNLYPVLWSSPHIINARERFSFEGRMISGEELLELFKKYEFLCEKFSYYEFLFFCFCQHFLTLLESGSLTKPPLLILEVGLGGRLDATNYFNAEVACLTSIGRDHIELLGPKLSDILREKIAISRSGYTLVSGVSQLYLKSEVQSYCQEKKIILKQVGYTKKDSFKSVNLQLAREVWFELFLEEAVFYKKKNLWARPLVVTDKRHEFILLGTHNLDGLKKLPPLRFDEEMKHFLPADEILLAMTRTNKNDVEQFINLLATFPCLGKKIVLTSFDHTRATELDFIKESIGSLAERENIVVCENWKERHSKYKMETKVLVLGSYFFMGDVFRYLLSREYTLSTTVRST